MSSGEKFTLICPCAILLHKLLSLLKSSLDACEDSGVVQRLVDSGIWSVRMYLKVLKWWQCNILFLYVVCFICYQIMTGSTCMKSVCGVFGNQMSIFLMKSMKSVPSLVSRQDCRCAAILCQTLLKHVLILFQHVKDSMHQGTRWGWQLVWSCAHQTQGGSTQICVSAVLCIVKLTRLLSSCWIIRVLQFQSE